MRHGNNTIKGYEAKNVATLLNPVKKPLMAPSCAGGVSTLKSPRAGHAASKNLTNSDEFLQTKVPKVGISLGAK